MLLLLFACLAFPVGCLLIVVGLRQGARRKAGSSVAEGRIIDAEAVGAEADDDRNPEVKLTFQYKAAGKQLEAEQVVRSWLLRIAGNLASFMESYSPGTQIKVLYDPERPDEAVVDLGWSWTGGPLIALGVFLLLFSVAPIIPADLWRFGFLGLWALVGVGLLITGGRDLQQEGGLHDWPSTYGTIVSSRLMEGEPSELGTGPLWWPEVEFEYEVQGTSHRSKRIQRSGPILYGNRSWAEKTLNRYPVGEQVQVFYDPDDPASAVLERGTSRGKLLVVMGLVLILGATTAIFFLASGG